MRAVDKVDTLISIVVPVYNVEKYLSKCIDSILVQTYKKLEIILVNDGSTDCSGEICNTYANKDTRIQVIHKKNGGLSDARNTGLRVAQGEYVGFVDSDDWIEPEMMECLYAACIKNKTKMACCGRYDVSEKGGRRVGICPEREEVVSAETMLTRMFCSQGCSSVACDKLYHYSVFEGVNFPVGKIYEDIPTTYKCVIKAGKVSMCNKPLYNYFHRTDSITQMDFSPRIFDYTNHTQQVLDDIKDNYPVVIPAAMHMRLYAVNFVLTKLSKQEKVVRERYATEYRILLRELRKQFPFWRKSKVFSLKIKLTFFIHAAGAYRMCKTIETIWRKRNL